MDEEQKGRRGRQTLQWVLGSSMDAGTRASSGWKKDAVPKGIVIVNKFLNVCLFVNTLGNIVRGS